MSTIKQVDTYTLEWLCANFGRLHTTQGNQIFSFDSTTPGTLLTFQPVTGFVGNPSGDESIGGGIDIRPANGKLYGVSQNARIYTIDPLTGIATLASTIHSAQPLPSFFSIGGFDFDPVADRLRVVSTDVGNLSVNVDTGEAIAEGALHFAPGDVESNLFTSGLAYTNNSAGATATTLYAVTVSDAPNSWVLDTMDPPSTGTLHSVGLFDTFCCSSAAGFDISGVTGTAYFASGNTLFTVNLQTGLATRIGTIGDFRLGNGNVIQGIAAPVGAPEPIPEPTSLALIAAGLVGLGFLSSRQHSFKRNTKLLAE